MKITKELYEQAKKIKILILDVDGVMTDGNVLWIEGTGWTRSFSIKDGYGLKLLMKTGVQVGIISGGDSKSVRERGKFLGIQHIYLGDENKLVPYEKIKAETNTDDSEISFVGDELFDIPVLEKVGLSATVPHAVQEVKDVVDLITDCGGGQGACRDIADLIRHSQEQTTYESFMNKYVRSYT